MKPPALTLFAFARTHYGDQPVWLLGLVSQVVPHWRSV